MDEKQDYINKQYEKKFDKIEQRFDKIENRIDKLENKMDSFELSMKEQTIILNQIKADLDSRKARNEKNMNDIIMKIILVALSGGLGIIGTALFK